MTTRSASAGPVSAITFVRLAPLGRVACTLTVARRPATAPSRVDADHRDPVARLVQRAGRRPGLVVGDQHRGGAGPAGERRLDHEQALAAAHERDLAALQCRENRARGSRGPATARTRPVTRPDGENWNAWISLHAPGRRRPGAAGAAPGRRAPRNVLRARPGSRRRATARPGTRRSARSPGVPAARVPPCSSAIRCSAASARRRGRAPRADGPRVVVTAEQADATTAAAATRTAISQRAHTVRMTRLTRSCAP